MRKHWVGAGGTAADFTGDSTVNLQQVGGTGGLADAFTVLRMLGGYTIFPTSAPVAGDEVTVSYGIGVVSSDAATVGASALPDPGTEPEYPWLYWASHALGYSNNSVQQITGAGAVRVDFDIKSMRKIKPSESLVSVAQYNNVATGGNPPLTIVVGGLRVLVAH